MLKDFFRNAVLAAVLAISLAQASAQSYPVKPIRLIVPYPPGGGTDIFARILGTRLGEALGQQVVIENRAGAAGVLGADTAAKAAPDGYTLLVGQASNLAINQHLMSKLPYDPVRDFAPITLIATSPSLLVVHPSLPVRTIKDLVALAKAKPGTINYASAGSGSPGHLAAEYFKKVTQTDIVHIPYKGATPVGVHLLIADPSASTIVPVERKGRPTVIPNWIVVLEGISIGALDNACDAHLAEEQLRAHGGEAAPARETYSLQIMVANRATFVHKLHVHDCSAGDLACSVAECRRVACATPRTKFPWGNASTELMNTLHCCCRTAILALALLPVTTAAQQFPARPMRMISPSPPGGSVDFLARTVAQYLAQRYGVPVIVDNRVGASAVIGTELLAKSAPDGYTLMMGYSTHATNPIFIKKLPYDTLKDFAGVVHVGDIPLLLVVHPSVAATSVRELIALAKARPGQLQFAAGAAGGGPSMAGLLLKQSAGIDIVQVSYKGNAPALTDVLGGQVTMMFDTINTSIALAKAGRLRALAVTSRKRSSLAPELPTMIEAGLPGFDVRAWFFVLAPARTPRDIVQKLNADINQGLNDPDIRARLSADGIELVGGTPEEIDAFIRAEMARWPKIIKPVE